MEDEQDDCYYGNVWVWRPVDGCVTTLREMVGVLCGVTSVFFLLLAHVILVALDKRKCDLPRKFPYILLGQTVADCITGLGAIFSRQIGIQVYFGLFLIFMDVVRLIKWMLIYMAVYCHRGRYRPDQDKLTHSDADADIFEDADKRATQLDKTILPVLFGPLILTVYSWPFSHQTGVTVPQTNSFSSNFKSRALLSIKRPTDIENIGHIFGILGAMLDVLTKLPIFVKMFQDKTLGKRRYAFSVLITISNIYYIFSVICADVTMTHVIQSLPWLLGRSALVVLDLMLLLKHTLNVRKSWKNGPQTTVEEEPLLEEELPMLEPIPDSPAPDMELKPPPGPDSHRHLREYMRQLVTKMGLPIVPVNNKNLSISGDEKRRIDAIYQPLGIGEIRTPTFDQLYQIPDHSDGGDETDEESPASAEFENLPMVGIGAPDNTAITSHPDSPHVAGEFQYQVENGSPVLRQVNSVNILAEVGPEEDVDLELDEDQIYKILAAEDQKRRSKSGSDLNSEFDDFTKERSIMAEIYHADEFEKMEQMENIMRENDQLIEQLNSDAFNPLVDAYISEASTVRDEGGAFWFD